MSDDQNREDNQAQQQSDATADVETTADAVGAEAIGTNINRINDSDASGIPPDDERAGEIRKRLHDDGKDPYVG